MATSSSWITKFYYWRIELWVKSDKEQSMYQRVKENQLIHVGEKNIVENIMAALLRCKTSLKLG